MADGVFAAAVVTPEEVLLVGPTKAVVLRSSEGFLTVLDGHADLVTDIVPGEVRVEDPEGTVVHLAVQGGYLQVETGIDLEDPGTGEVVAGRSTRVTVLAGVAERAEDIDVERAERARAAAEERVNALRAAGGRSDTTTSGEDGADPADVELVEAEAALRRAEVRLEVAGAPRGTAHASA